MIACTTIKRALASAFLLLMSVPAFANTDIVYPPGEVLSFCQQSGCDNQVFYRFYESKKARFCREREIILDNDKQSMILQFLLERSQETALPTTSVVVPILESSLNPSAAASSSRNAAKGLWQLKPDTARDMGLQVGAQLDERLDIQKSTAAGFKYLSWLEGKFSSSESPLPPAQVHNLAVLAYHVGIGRVSKMIEKHNTRNPWFLSKLISDHRPDRDYLLKYYAYSLALMNKGCSNED